ncbi:RraA family protein [Denitrobaculum tricleocarpae]|uniref:Putative 4-hydroxy-4-methyl-2-oxoglutarate aldolase n=1 Tax=Denitrobaculum tricleocarpae TaxID=2591009 RepID=A0A545U1J5_9PROT|nr:RraA family protein [Denitrobaculum tricleocarpae]TQV83359.1 RraA family protein [Denitrobaculum tricleocarpae]
MPPYSNDDELFTLLRSELFTAVVGDILDKLGFQHQFLPAGIAPLKSGMTLAGRAMPVLEADVFEDNRKGTGEAGRGPLSGKPFGLMLEALDDLKPGEIYVATGASLRYALWGELMSTRAQHLKANGAVLDGYLRDADAIEALGFPAFCRGVYAQDQGPRGKVVDFRCGIEIGGVYIEPGTLLFGDREGVLTIPKPAEEEVIRLSLEKAAAENKVGEAIRAGMGAVEAFETFGVM